MFVVRLGMKGPDLSAEGEGLYVSFAGAGREATTTESATTAAPAAKEKDKDKDKEGRRGSKMEPAQRRTARRQMTSIGPPSH